MDTPWHFELFGPLCALSDTHRLTHFRTNRGAALLAYLSLKPGQPRTRDILCCMLWNDTEDTAKLRARLRWELSWLRGLLGKEVFVTQGNSAVALAPEITSDVAEFETALVAAVRATSAAKRLEPLRRALTLYKGDLLPDLYEEWVLTERTRLREAFFESVLTRLILDLEHEAIYDEAQQVRRLAHERFPDKELPLYRYSEQMVRSSVRVSDNFYGREAELGTIVDWARAVGAKRLLTLTGAGGIGKTRLTREAIALLPQEVLWVPLADLQDAGRLFEAVRDALNLAVHPDLSARTQVVDALRERRSTVLLLDNLEQVAPRVAPLVRALLGACPHLKCLVTSRRPLKLEQEKELAVMPLGLEPSRKLFLSRARQIRPDFACTPDAQEQVRDICQLLEGIPLALELAAARALVVGPSQIRAQLAHCLRFLVSVRPQKDRRHQSLHATILWSYELLTPGAQRVFAQLSLFRGGFTLEAAQQVCGDDPPMVDALEELVLHALLLVVFSPADETARYELLGVIREFAQEKLHEDAETEQQTQARHRECYVQAAGQVRELVDTGSWATASALVRLELANFRVAMESSDSQTSLDFFDGLALLLFELGLWSDLDRLMQAMEPALTQDPTSLRTAGIWGLRAAIARRRGKQDEAWRYWESRLEILERLELPGAILGTLLEMAGQAIDERKSVLAHRLLGEGERRARQAETPSYTLELRVLRARLAFMEKEHTSAQSLLREIVRQLQEEETTHQARLYALHYLCPLCRALRFVPELEWMLREGLTLNFSEGRLFNLGVLVLELARHREQQGSLEEAGRAYYVAREIQKELKSRLQNEAKAELDAFVAKHLATDRLHRLEAMPWRGVYTQLYLE